MAYNIDALVSWWAGKMAQDINIESCKTYAEARLRAPAKAHRALAVLGAAMNHAVKRERLESARPMWRPSGQWRRDRWLTRAEAVRLLRAARNEPQSRDHLPMFVLLGLYGGARPGAILDLRWDQVDLERGRITWNPDGRQQTQKRRSLIPVPKRLLTILRIARRRRRWPTSPVVNIDGRPVGSVKKAFAAACAHASLDNVTPHTLRHTCRHTCGTWMAQAGVSLWDIAGYLGHSMQTTTEPYAHHHPDYMDRAREALDRRV